VKRTSTTKYPFTWLSKKIPVSLVASAEAELRKTPAETPFDE
jgi:hypothetical protein